MSSELDPAKLKVVELRAELQARGLDVKGNKPVLVKRLKEALEAEENEESETMVGDTTAENEEEPDEQEEEEKEDEKPAKSSPKKETAPVPVKEDSPDPEPEPECKKESESESEEETLPSKKDEIKEEVEEAVVEEESKEVKDEEEVSEQNGESANGDTNDEESSEPKNRKSRWGNEEQAAPEPMEQQSAEETEEIKEAVSTEEATVVTTPSATRGEKRKRSSPSPERPNIQRRRSKSPNKEDDPLIDSSKVQLSWYDSDLHLHIDKTTFLSAKPLHDGVFAYVWAGARLSHGAKSGKVCYEVKVTEELKFEDILKLPIREQKQRGKKDKQGRFERNRKAAEAAKPAEVKPEGDAAKMETDEKGDEAVEEVKTPDESSKDDEVKTPDEKIKSDDKVVEEEAKKDEEADAKMEVEEAKTDSTEKVDDKVEEVEVKAEELHNIPPYLIRIGWSTSKSTLQLGEDKYSYGLESSGKFFNNCEFTDHDVKFVVGDVVGAYLEFTEEYVIMSFTVNGETKLSKNIARSEIDEDNLALFPHILTRNYGYEINAGDREEVWFPHPDEFCDFVFISQDEEKVEGPPRPLSRSDCEVVMMVGLPGSGKTQWVTEFLEKTTDVTYTVIGNKFLLQRMTVDGKPISDQVNKPRYNVILDRVSKVMNKLCDMACLKRRNYILDQTNVFPSAQRRKMRSFWDFKRHAVVVVNEDEEQTRRMKQLETQTGKDIPENTVLEMKANMSIPQKTADYPLEIITYASLGETEALAVVQKYNKQGKEAGYGLPHRRDHRDDRGYNNRWGHGGGGGPRRDYRGGNYRDNNRPYHSNRYSDRGHRQQGGSGGWRPGGGGGGANWGGQRNDRRDNRGPREWMMNNRGRMNDRPHRGGSGGGGGGAGNREHRNHGGSGGNFNRNRNQGGSGGGGGRNQGGWGGGNQVSTWNNQGQGGGNWGSQGQGQNNWGQGWNQGQGSWNQNQWKYGGYGGGYGQYANWNYYGQYAQNWGQQGQSGQAATTAAGTATSNTSTDTTQYANMTPQQQQAAWAQYAQQYAQSTANQSQK